MPRNIAIMMAEERMCTFNKSHDMTKLEIAAQGWDKKSMSKGKKTLTDVSMRHNDFL